MPSTCCTATQMPRTEAGAGARAGRVRGWQGRGQVGAGAGAGWTFAEPGHLGLAACLLGLHSTAQPERPGQGWLP